MKKIVGYLPLIFSGCDYSGKTFLLNKIHYSSNSNVIQIAKKFTTIKTLQDQFPEQFFYLDKGQFEALIKKEPILMVKKVEEDYFAYFKEPIQNIISSKKICLLSCDYEQIETIMKSGIIKANIVNLIPNTPIQVAQKIFENKYSKISSNNNDDVYDKIHEEVEFYRSKILKYYQNNMFSCDLTNNYDENIVNEAFKMLKILYPTMKFRDNDNDHRKNNEAQKNDKIKKWNNNNI